MATKAISPLEKEIMELVWKNPGITVSYVRQRLANRKLAYTTVATVLHRLYDKGLLERKPYGRAYVFSPKISKESYTKTLAKNFLSKFFTSYGNVAITSFAESVDRLPKEKRRYLLKLLKK